MISTIELNKKVELVKEIADRMRDPDHVRATVIDPTNYNPKPLYDTSPWGGISLEGYGGVLILFAQLDHLFPDEQWDAAAHQYVLKIKTIIETDGLNFMPLSLFGGLAGVCFALQQASRKGSRYQRLINILNDHLLENVENQYLVPLRDNLKNGKPSPMHLYDLIQGIVGIGSYALSNLSDLRLFRFSEELVEILIGFTKPILVEGKWSPGWYVPAQFQRLEEEKHSYPLGNFNLGLSHGVTGILAFLTIALLRGISLSGQKEAIEKIAFWLSSQQKEDQGTLFWPTIISFEEEIALSKERQCRFSGRDAWCYGTPGVARTLFLAGKAIGNESLINQALDSLCSVFKRNHEQWFLPGPTFCHGIAGLMMITLQMANDSQRTELKGHLIFLNKLLLEYYHSEYPFGFKNYAPCIGHDHAQLNQVGLLEGTSGILLTILSSEHSCSCWHAPFLISYGE